MVNLLLREKIHLKLTKQYNHYSFFQKISYEDIYSILKIEPFMVKCPEGSTVEVGVPYYCFEQSLVGLVGLKCDCCQYQPPTVRIDMSKETKRIILDKELVK